MTHNKESERFVEAVLKATEILNCFIYENSLSLKQLVDKTNLNRSRAMRLTGTLVSQSYLFYDKDSKKFYLGSKLLTLGKSFERNYGMSKIIKTILKQLVKETKESSTFSIVEGDERVTLAREEGSETIRYSIMEGQRMPLYAGAAGKILLSYSESNLFKSLIKNNKLIKITNDTITDIEDLKIELSKIRQEGYALSFGENTEGTRAIAAPVFNADKKIAGALSIAAPSFRINEKNRDEKIASVVKAAKELSKAMGYN